MRLRKIALSTALAMTVVPPTASGAAAAPAVPALAECGGQASALMGGAWGGNGWSSCSYWGRPGATITYTWRVARGTQQQACAQGWGFDVSAPRGRWFDIGCGTSGTTRVPWGNVAATPKVRVKSISPVFIATVTFTH